MMLPHASAPTLSPEDRKTLVTVTLTVLASTLVSGLVTWGLEEGKRVAAERRETARKAAEESEAWRKHLSSP